MAKRHSKRTVRVSRAILNGLAEVTGAYILLFSIPSPKEYVSIRAAALQLKFAAQRLATVARRLDLSARASGQKKR